VGEEGKSRRKVYTVAAVHISRDRFSNNLGVQKETEDHGVVRTGRDQWEPGGVLAQGSMSAHVNRRREKRGGGPNWTE